MCMDTTRNEPVGLKIAHSLIFTYSPAALLAALRVVILAVGAELCITFHLVSHIRPSGRRVIKRFITTDGE